MDSSFAHTKRFIDGQIRVLGSPLQMSEALRHILDKQHRFEGSDTEAEANEEETTYLQDRAEITPEMMKKILAKVNLKIKRHNSNIFRLQITNQIVQQVLKLESTKLSIVNDQLLKINTILKPLLVPDFTELEHLGQRQKIRQFSELLSELPPSRYLLLAPSDGGSDEDKGSRKFELEVIRQVLETNKTEDALFKRYDELKANLISLNDQLMYKHDKHRYLETISEQLKTGFNLKHSRVQSVACDSEDEVSDDEDLKSIQSNLLTNVTSTDEDNLISEINKFRVLVEKIGFKLGSRNLREILHGVSGQNADAL